MRIIITISLLLALLLTCSVQADMQSDLTNCKKKYPNLYNGLAYYCLGPGGTGFTSPGTWAKAGGVQHGRKFGVGSGYRFGGNTQRGPPCSPVAWIPAYWCK